MRVACKHGSDVNNLHLRYKQADEHISQILKSMGCSSHVSREGGSSLYNLAADWTNLSQSRPIRFPHDQVKADNSMRCEERHSTLIAQWRGPRLANPGGPVCFIRKGRCSAMALG